MFDPIAGPLVRNRSRSLRKRVLDVVIVVQLCAVLLEKILGSYPLDELSGLLDSVSILVSSWYSVSSRIFGLLSTRYQFVFSVSWFELSCRGSILVL